MFESNEITPQKIDNPPSNALAPDAQVTRRQMIVGGAATIALLNLPFVARASRPLSKSLNSRTVRGGAAEMMISQDGTSIFFRDWGRGRSEQSRGGNDLNTYADDLAQLLEFLKLEDVMLVGHSTGGGGVVRYIGRHGDRRLSKLVLIGSIVPALMKSEKNPDGIALSAFNDVRTGVASYRSHFLKNLSIPFFGYNKPGVTISQGVKD